MSIEEIEWLEVVDEYARSIAANIPGDGAQLAVKHLIAVGHISKHTIVRHMALLWYPSALQTNDSRKMAAVTDVAVRLNVTERTIWSIVSRKRQKKKAKI